MTPEQRELVKGLYITAPNRPRALTPSKFLRRFGARDGVRLGAQLLRNAYERRDSSDVELAMVVTSVFGVGSDHYEPLVNLLSEDWHQSHEDAVWLLGRLRRQDAVDALYGATQRVPEYLEYDEARALAVKAIWALGAIPGERARAALAALAGQPEEPLRREAAYQLERRETKEIDE